MLTPTAPPCPPRLPKQGYAGPSQFGPQRSPWCAVGPLACPKRVIKQAQPCCSLCGMAIGLADPHSTDTPTKFAQTRLRTPPASLAPSAALAVQWVPWHAPRGLLNKPNHVVASLGW